MDQPGEHIVQLLEKLGHELRNPLAPVLSAVQVLMERGIADQECQLIERQVQHMTRIIDDLLDVARITHGQMQLNKECLELADIVTQAVEMSRPYIEERGHQLEIQMPVERLLVHADEVRLGQVLTHLLSNAAKYTERGGHVTLSVRRDDGGICVECRDDGMGISEEQLSHIFEPFPQSNNTNDPTRSGLGVGLTLARSLAELHGGRVTAASQGKGRGSTFTLWLPAAQESAASSERCFSASSAPLR